MKRTDVLISWFISLTLGSIICSVFTGDLVIAIVFFIVSALFSSPYLLFMSLYVNKLKSFLHIQLLHASLAFLTTVFILFFIPEFFRYFYIVLPYYVVGILSHYYFHVRNKEYRYVQPIDLLDKED